MASITVGTVGGDERYYPLGKAAIVVGRGEQVAVQVVDEQVSVRHLQIRFDAAEGTYHALDMKSRNGTRINGRPLTGDVTLADGDHLEIGRSAITFHDRNFPDKADAFRHHKQPGQRARSTQIG